MILSIIIPVYNEEKTIITILEKIKQNASKSFKYEIIVLWEIKSPLSGSIIINKERRRGLNPRSLQRLLSSSRSFFNYLIDL